MITAVIFDKDGCLFSFQATWADWGLDVLRLLSTSSGVPLPPLAAAMGFDLDTKRFMPSSPVIAGTPEDLATALGPLLPDMPGAEIVDVANRAAERIHPAEAVPLRPLLEALRGRGLALGVATNDAEAPARAHLQTAGVEGLFDRIYGSDSGVGAKPGPGQLHAFAEAVDHAPQNCAMVGDSLHDLQAARAAGMAAVGVLTGVAGAGDLSPLADVVLPDIGHLPDWLDRRSAD